MPLFNNDVEKQRKENLKILEEKRVAFAEKLEKMNFKPERMIFFSSENGTFTALARVDGKYAAVIGPAFGTDEDFVLDIQDQPNFEREDIFEKGTGLNGAFGFGTKGAKGFRLHFNLTDGTHAALDVVAGRTSWLESLKAAKNPLLRTKRRRGDANLVWDMMPIDPASLTKIEDTLAKFYIND